MATPNKTGGSMSSRLLTMKFMQRGAASPSSATSTPDQRSAKRQRLSDTSFRESPVATPDSDAAALQQVLAAEERKRQGVIDREAARRGETKWVLDVKLPQAVKPPPVTVVSAGYAALDRDASRHDDVEEDSEDFDVPQAGRRSFGSLPTTTKPSNPDQDEDDFESDSDSTDDETETASRARQPKTADSKSRALKSAQRSKHGADITKKRAKAQQSASDKRKKLVNINKLTSISSAGSGVARESASIVCHRCGKKGHIKDRCPLGRAKKR